MSLRVFEDFRPGDVFSGGHHVVAVDEIIAFARQFDPLPMHVDPAAASRTMFGGLIASGWHTVSLLHRLIVDHIVPGAQLLGSPGVDGIEWRQPVRPGDAVSARVTILDARRSKSRPDRGLVKARNELLRDRTDILVVLNSVAFYACETATSVN
jgi:acyl dehydratase